MPSSRATASASSTTSSSRISRSPSAMTDTLYLMRLLSSDAWEFAGELLETPQVVTRDDRVDVGFGDHHSEGRWPVVGGVPSVGIHPDDPVAEARQGFHGIGEHLGISTVEPVGADHDDPASGEAAPGA